ncbi:hypothetical protein [Streptomyces roseochromogenus]|uniref:hypothetical protein n=1 Tax=Streptomyces roseochromogenus TaxID=285450 RepID=UPI001FD780E9|nr:hypothetical protein [Streptomyces roseochromogenus]
MAGTILTAVLVAPAASAVAATPAAQRAGATATVAPAAASPWRTVKLVDGSTGKIYKLGAHHYRMEIVYRGEVYARLEANQHDAGVDGNGMYVVLTLDGKVHSWTGGTHQGPGSFRLPDGSTAVVTRVGLGHYRAQIVYRGEVYARLEANQHDAGVDGNGMFVVLSMGGQISASVR